MFALAQVPPERARGHGRRVVHWRLATNRPGELHVTLLRPVVRYDELRPLFDWLLSDEHADWEMITFDFQQVRDVVAPWVPVFAHLEYVIAQTRADCRLLGLNPRLTNMAAFAMGAVAARDLSLSPAGAVQSAGPEE
jgi:hypothetical protein